MDTFKLTVLGLFLIIATMGCETSSSGKAKMLQPEDLQLLLKNGDVQLVDVRTPKEFKEGHIPTAQNINVKSPTFNDEIKKLHKNNPVIVYCRSGVRSAKCAKKLFEAGFTEVYDLQGGITSWKQKDLR